MIENLNVLKKMLIIGTLTLISFIAIGTIFLLDQKNMIISEKKSKLVNLVEIPYSIAEAEYKAFQEGKIDEQTAKTNAINAIKNFRYDTKNYIWINDDKMPYPTMIMHPIATKLDGTILNEEKYNCATNLQFGVDGDTVSTDGKKNLFQSFVEVSNKSGSGFVKYLWPKPKEGGGNTEEKYEKLSFVKKFDKWGWVIGTGVYIDDVNAQFTKSLTKIALIVLVIILLLSVVFYAVIKDIVSKIELLGDGLSGFFKFLNKETNNTKQISIDCNDEIGKMAKTINDNIAKTQKLIEQDQELIDDVKRVVNDVKLGKLKQKITRNTQNENLQELKNNFNEMLENTSKNVSDDINKITRVLNSFSKFDFRDRIENDNGTIEKGLNQLANIINEMLKENKSNGLTLNESSKVLLSNVNVLNISSNEAASSLEETAAALEEITSNLRSNTENIGQMSVFSNKVTKSVLDGEKLASQTTQAMEDINTQVQSISEAIAVIDQIAFQTNILSLNAAVEAATAGEAGKGFAVVAAEVRNLATRSAEAAKEIKVIVENATNKANQGKEIANNMISGYKDLNQNIAQTMQLIEDIEMSSKEQLKGIEQINDAVSQLDQQTQQNASVASQTHDIAILTDKIATMIVKDADSKEFIGKSEVRKRVI
jgi:methyl-accepting chemotaxis protein